MTIRELHFPQDEAFYRAAFEWRQRFEPGAWEGFVIKPSTVRDFGIFEGEKLLGVLVLMHTRAGETEAGLIVPERPRLRSLIRAYRQMTANYFAQGIGHRLFTVTQPCEAHHKLMRHLGWRALEQNTFEYTLLDHVQPA